MARPRKNPVADATTTQNVKEEKVMEQTTKKAVRIVGDAVVITSSVKMADIEKLKKVQPEALALVVETKSGETEEIFRVSTGEIGAVSKYGITFANTDKDGYAQVTTMIPSVENKKAFVVENFATTISKLKALEAQISNAIVQVTNFYRAFELDIEEV